MNWKSGLRRLAIVAALFWAVGWSYYAYIGDMYMKVGIEGQNRLEAIYPNCFSDRACLEQHSYLQQEINEAGDMIGASVIYGIGIPVALIILAPFGWFVYRGFRPRRGQEGAAE
jgi:hypothetical protein